jgi:hypothetical protein
MIIQRKQYFVFVFISARDVLKRLGSKRAQVIGWRDMWAMVLVKKDKVFGEAMSKSPGDNTAQKKHI